MAHDAHEPHRSSERCELSEPLQAAPAAVRWADRLHTTHGSLQQPQLAQTRRSDHLLDQQWAHGARTVNDNMLVHGACFNERRGWMATLT